MIKIKVEQAVKLQNEYSMFISFPYDNRILDVIRSFPSSTRFWHSASKEWEMSLLNMDKLLAKLPEQEFDITAPNIEITKPDAKIPKDFEFKTKPFNHQFEGFKYGLSKDRWFLGDEQGLGKTKQVIDIAIAKRLQKGYKHCLIICGVNGLKWNWVNEIYKHSNEKAYILGQRKKLGKYYVSSVANRINDLQNLDKIQPYFIITNIETIRNEEITKELQKLCNNGVIGMIAIDEIHKCKNPTSQQGKGILKLQTKTMIAMTGTPLMNQPLDLYIILKWLGYENHSFYAFKNYYCEMGGFGGYEIIGYKHLSELKSQIDDIMLRRLKKDVLDLPEKTYIDEYVEMTDKQAKIYKEITAEIKDNIDKIVTAPNPLAELIRMRQATGYTGILSSTIKESAKLDRMEELVKEAVVDNKRSVVIFSNWTQMTDIIAKRLSKYKIGVITGQTPDDERQQLVEDFQNEDDIEVLIGTIGAMGTGLTLTAGTVEIFMDEPWSRALKEQAEDRCHRVGTTQNVTIYTLMCKNTIDERVHDLVLKKGAIADALVDVKVVDNRAELLDFLLS